MSAAAKLTRGSIRGHLISQTLPAIIGVGALMSVGLIDAYFIGQLGSAELAAIAFVFPVSVTIISLGVGTMVGINSVVARALGAGDIQRADRRANFGILMSLAFGIALCLILLALIDPLFSLMRAEQELLPVITAYMRPFAYGLPVIMTIMGINGVMRGMGEAKKTSYISITYALANVILDPLFITGGFGFEGFGIAGAAYATIAGWSIGIALGLYLLGKTTLPFRPRHVEGLDVKGSLRDIVRVAAPAAFSNAINPLGLSVLTTLLAAEGSAAVAGFGAAGRLQSFVLVPLLALSGSIGAIVGQNWGADQPDRSRLAMLEAGLFAIAYGLVVAILLANFGGWFAQFFTEDADVAGHFGLYLSIAVWGYAGYGLLIVANGAMNAVDRADISLAQSCGRVFLVMLPIAWLLQANWGAVAIYTAELAANALGGIIAGIMAWKILKARTGDLAPTG